MKPGLAVFVVAVVLVVLALDWLMVVPHWVSVAVVAGSVASAGAVFGTRAMRSRKRDAERQQD
jgi:hypothetical protein